MVVSEFLVAPPLSQLNCNTNQAFNCALSGSLTENLHGCDEAALKDFASTPLFSLVTITLSAISFHFFPHCGSLATAGVRHTVAAR